MKAGKTFALLILAGALAAPAMAQTPPNTPATLPPPSTGSTGLLAHGYLNPDQLPDSVAIVPPPPAPGSAAQARDDEAAAKAVAQQGSARWALATRDADLMRPDFIDTFSCAAGIKLDPTATPAIANLLRRAAASLAMSTRGAKNKYQRQRPFMVTGKPTCTPDWEAVLRKDGSYPSGHSAIGYGIGLILAEAIPSHATDLIARGEAFGDSRRICNVHWQSDIEQGRIMASATVARLNAEQAFRDDVAAARAEADAALAAHGSVGHDCALEAATIAATR